MAYRVRTFFQTFALASSVSLLAACGGSDDGATPETVSGVFIDSAVEGLRYVSGSLSGTTNASGEFQCQSSIQFYVGDILLGNASCNEVITPVDLVSSASSDPTHPTVSNIARFLQTLDDDGNPENGITITTAVANLASGQTIDFHADFDTNTNIQSLVNTMTSARNAGAANLVSTTSAKAHLENSMFEMMVGTYKGSYSGDDSGTWTIIINSSGTIIGVTGDSRLISGGVISAGNANFSVGSTGQTSTYRGKFNLDGNASGTWLNQPARGSWSGNKISESTDTTVLGDVQFFDPNGTVCSGSLNISGKDSSSTAVGTSFTPNVCIQNSSLSDNSISWIHTLTRANLTLSFLDDGSPKSLNYAITDESGTYSYKIDCLKRFSDCSGISLDTTTNNVSFTDVILPKANITSGHNRAKAPITIEGTLTYKPAIQ